ncbi:MAG: S-methyl-5-thioribose-1-phosphate isomerase [Lachnospiraceae bacterium]|nr:S-methyl-5-thioribose-1-phosphate isomerase [Lachnospiraceae bacterium]
MKENILNYPTVDLNEAGDAVLIIDQTLLPKKLEMIELKGAKELWDAIYLLKVRGAPAIGVFAAYALYVLSLEIAKQASTAKEFYEEFKKQKEYLNSARPTAVNLSWALERMERICEKGLSGAILPGAAKGSGTSSSGSPDDVGMIRETLSLLKEEAVSIHREDTETCRKIGEYGLGLIKPGYGILTHCNAGQLATSKYGTATAPIYLAHEKGYDLKVYADETRPLLQGARLTASELSAAGLDVTLLCDNMSGSLMRSGAVNAVFVGCDRVAMNGDVANKIGTSMVATLAKYYGVPFYVCAPTSTLDPSTKDGSLIRIEQRPASEITEMWYSERMAPEGISVYNPAFDVTDHDLVTAIITERGIAYPPYEESLPEMLER